MRALALSVLLLAGCGEAVGVGQQALEGDEAAVQVIHRPGWPLSKPEPARAAPAGADGGRSAAPACDLTWPPKVWCERGSADGGAD